AAMRHARIVEGFDFLCAVASESYCTAVGIGGCLAVDRLGNSEGAGRGAIEEPALRINLAFRYPDGAERGIIKPFGDCNVVRANKNMREHFYPPGKLADPGWPRRRRFATSIGTSSSWSCQRIHLLSRQQRSS